MLTEMPAHACRNCAWFQAGWVWIPLEHIAVCRNPKTFPAAGDDRYHLGKTPGKPTPRSCSSLRASYGKCGPEGKLFVRAEAIGNRFTRFRRWLPQGWSWGWVIAGWPIALAVIVLAVRA